MAYWIDETGIDNMKNSSNYRMYKCDKESDVAKLPTYKKKGEEQKDDISTSNTCIYGSECYCIENGKYYTLTKDTDTWVAKPSMSGGYPDINLDEYAKKTDIPKTLPASDVYDWAKQENKPTYTAKEVGAIASTKESRYDAAVTQSEENKKSIELINGSGDGSIAKALSDAKSYADELGKNYATTAQGKKADTSVQSVKIQGNDTELKSGTNVVIPAFPNIDANAIKQEITAEGEKQVQAVQTAAQEIVADREQIQTNKSDIADLRQSKAGAVTETVSGETIQVKDSAVAGFEGMRVFGKSTQDGVPTPENPVPIVNVGNEGTVNIKITGKNLIPFPYKDGFLKDTNGVKITVDDNGIITFDGTSNGSVMFTVFNEKIPLKEGKAYYISDGLNAQLNGIAGNSVAKKYTAKKGDYISQLWHWFPSGTNFVSQTFKPQFEIGDMATEFEIPRKLQVLALATPNGLPGIPVDSGGNYTDENGQQWVCDEIDLGRGKYIQWLKEIIIDHNVTIHTDLSQYGAVEINTILSRFPNSDIKQNGALLCRELPISHITNWENDSESVYCTEKNNIDFRLSRERLGLGAETSSDENREAVLKYLETHPLHCFVERPNPIERNLTPEEIEAYKALHTNYPTTVITNDSGAGMKVGYVADTKLYIDKKIDELNKALVNTQAQLL